MYAKYGDNPKNEYLEKRLFCAVRSSKRLESNAKIEGFA